MTKEDIGKFSHLHYDIILRAQYVAKKLWREYLINNPELYEFSSELNFDEAFVRIYDDGSITVWSDEVMNNYLSFIHDWNRRLDSSNLPYEALWDDSILERFAEAIKNKDEIRKAEMEAEEHEKYLKLQKKFYWKTGEPKEEGWYIVQWIDGHFEALLWNNESKWQYGRTDIKRWTKIPEGGKK